jgi:hypothetical protein
MGIAYNPKIVTNGLVLCLDAGNTKSYPGSGTTWTNLASSSFNATTVNSPTFTSNYFTLNGSTQYFTVSETPLTSVTTCTILMWIYSAASQANYTGLFYNRNGSNVSGMDFFTTTNKLGWTWNGDVTTYNYDTGLVVSQGVWSMVAISVGSTSTTFWVNSNSNTQTYTTAAQTFDAINIGRDPLSGRLFNGRIGVTGLYNRALTAAEIQQNFNATRGRYGI